jgi:CDP-diacylglycerol---glycerol-3-phosphate 3-phosphatidyltransferase
MILNVPNIITFSRILLIPVLTAFLLMIDPEKPLAYNQCMSLWAASVFAIAAISDLVDGYYARKFGEVSKIGKFFDPMADKLIHMTAMVLLIPLNRIAAWIVVVLLFREIFITGLRAMAAGEGIIIDAAAWGKRKTAWLNVGLSALLIYYPLFPGKSYELNSYAVGMVCIAIGFVYSVASAINYTLHFFKSVRK